MTPPRLQIPVRPDFDALDTSDAAAPSRTEDGRPWVRWAKMGEHQGWYATGSRKPQVRPSSPFWETVFSVACACAGSSIDQVHCCGPNILTLGGLGAPLLTGYAQQLLRYCLLADPVRYLDVMAPLIHATGTYVKGSPKSPTGVAFFDSKRHALLSAEDMRQMVSLGVSSAWSTAQKKRARLWVSCCSELLRSEEMDRAQHLFAQEVLPTLLTEETKTTVRWPRNPWAHWEYTSERKMLWALVLVLSLADEKETERLIEHVGAPSDTVDLDGLFVLRRIHLHVVWTDFPQRFKERCELALGLLATAFGVKL